MTCLSNVPLGELRSKIMNQSKTNYPVQFEKSSRNKRKGSSVANRLLGGKIQLRLEFYTDILHRFSFRSYFQFKS